MVVVLVRQSRPTSTSEVAALATMVPSVCVVGGVPAVLQPFDAVLAGNDHNRCETSAPGAPLMPAANSPVK